MKNKIKYYVLMILSMLLFITCITLLNNTKIIAPIGIVISIYLFIGSIIKLYKTNNIIKNNILHALDLLFWLP